MFRMMSIVLRVREPFKKPAERLRKVGLQEGQTVLDYGCGIGSYVIPASKIVGASGKVYALDIQPMAVDRVKKRAEKNGLSNVQTITSNIDTNLPDKSVDVVLLYDVLQMIRNREGLLQEFHRVLKSSGIVSVDCDHMQPEEVRDVFDSTGLFSQVDCENGVLKFMKQ
jgi:ubiquinone/menaquinone biosynthesis C-methylase UbiE